MIVCEGFATGASIHEATGHAVVVAFDRGNLEPVAKALRKQYPDAALIVAADDDHMTDGNPGRTDAKAAALAVGGTVVVPLFPAGRPDKATDFNDLHMMDGGGLDAVRACFSMGMVSTHDTPPTGNGTPQVPALAQPESLGNVIASRAGIDRRCHAGLPRGDSCNRSHCGRCTTMRCEPIPRHGW